MNLYELLDRAATLPLRLVKIETTIDRTLRAVQELCESYRSLIAQIACPPTTPTFVYVIPPDGAPLLMTSAKILPGTRDQIRFMSSSGLPPGCWVTVAGPATIRGVKVGNQLQTTMMADGNGHVCKTIDVCPVGCFLTVELEG
jgi:hypothetical protein